jgi:hypothetical protein
MTGRRLDPFYPMIKSRIGALPEGQIGVEFATLFVIVPSCAGF